MNDQELRALVRDAVARHLQHLQPPVHPQPPVAPTHQQDLQHLKHPQHPSHVMYRIINVGDSCVIEPSVTCNHCGYCKSHGH